jgi:hypothetical protein
MPADQAKCPTILIEDEPSSEDAFSTSGQPGPHARVATAIQQTIYSSSGGKVIGLEGGWGAGKSTVVHLLTTRLLEDANFVAVSFDAWAHEGDPLRRTYLETIAERLQSANWIDAGKWNDKLAVLARRTKRSITRTTRSPTILGVLLAVSLMLIPLGSALINDALKDYSITFNRHHEVAWQFILGVAFLVGPLHVALGRLIQLLWRRDSTQLRDPASWAFLSGKHDEDVTTDSSETPNPTSLEFESLFYELMNDALVDSNRRVLLIIDNLDRADAADALKIWATMQTFLHASRNRQRDWFRRIWVLVPYDRDGLQRLWDRERSGPKPLPLTVDLVPRVPAGDIPRESTAASFFEKSFQVRFQVPPLVHSDWRLLLNSLLEQALPNHKDDQRGVFKTLDHFRNDRVAPPTPRQLKSFVNQIGAIHRQWAHRFPLDHIAYFVLKSSDTRELIADLRSGHLPSEDAIRMLGPELKGSLAGLAFNVPAAKGMELLLSGVVFNALTSSDSQDDSLPPLAAHHGDGFWQTLDQLAFERFNELAPSVLARVIRTLHASAVLDEARPEAQSIKRAIVGACDKVADWTPFDQKIGAGLSSAISLVSDVKFTQRLVRAIEKTLESFRPNAEKAIGTGTQYAGALLQVLDTLRSVEHMECIPSEIVLPVSAAEWDQACAQLADMDPAMHFWRIFRPSCGYDAVVQFVMSAISNGQFTQRTIFTMKVTGSIFPDITWEHALPIFRQRLDAGTNVGSEEAIRLIEGYRAIKKSGKAQERPYRELFENGHILHHYHRAVQEKNLQARALFAFLHLGRYPANQRVGQSGNSEAGFQALESALGANDGEMAAALIDRLEQEGQAHLLFSIMDARGRADTLVVNCLREAAVRPRSHEVFTSDVIQQRWSMLKANLDDPAEIGRFSKALRTSLDNTGVVHDILGSEKGFNVASIPLYSEILNVEGSPAASELATWCGHKLSAVTSEEWATDFSQSFALAGLTLALGNRGVSPNFSLAFIDAVANHAAQVCRGQQMPPDFLSARWSQLMTCIGDESLRSNLRLQLIRVAADHSDGRLHDLFFDLYGGFIDEGLKSMKALEPLFRLAIGLVKHRGPARGLGWAGRALERAKPGHADPLTQDLRRELGMRVGQAINEVASEAIVPELKAIASALS